MAYWLFDLLFLVLPSGLLLQGSRRPTARTWRAVAVLAVVALLWTAPWDEHLVRSRVWSHGPDRVLGTVGSVPVEEYAFVVLLVVLVAAWGERTGHLRVRRGASSVAATVSRPGARCRGAAGWVAVGLLGAALLFTGGPWRYLGLLLVWVAPPLALQAAVAGDLLRQHTVDRLATAGPVALWLCVADRVALADGVWLINPVSSTGFLLLGLPVEEALFFVLVSLLVTNGLMLATHDEALRRCRGLLRVHGWDTAGRLTRRASSTRRASPAGQIAIAARTASLEAPPPAPVLRTRPDSIT